MPRASVLANAPRMATIRHLIQLKKLWIVSVAALAYRLHALELLTDWHYRTLCIEMAQLGYRTNEPEGAQRERSHILATVFAALRDEGVSKAAVAEQLQIEVDELDKLVFGLMITFFQAALKRQGLESQRRAFARGEMRSECHGSRKAHCVSLLGCVRD